MKSEPKKCNFSIRVIWGVFSATMLFISLLSIVLYFPYKHHLDGSETKHINNMVMYIEKIQKFKHRLPSHEEMKLWIERQDSQGTRYDGRGFDFIPFGENNYSIVFWTGDDFVKYNSTTNNHNIRVDPQKNYLNFVVLFVLSFLGLLLSVFPANLNKNG